MLNVLSYLYLVGVVTANAWLQSTRRRLHSCWTAILPYPSPKWTVLRGARPPAPSTVCPVTPLSRFSGMESLALITKVHARQVSLYIILYQLAHDDNSVCVCVCTQMESCRPCPSRLVPVQWKWLVLTSSRLSWRSIMTTALLVSVWRKLCLPQGRKNKYDFGLLTL